MYLVLECGVSLVELETLWSVDDMQNALDFKLTKHLAEERARKAAKSSNK